MHSRAAELAVIEHFLATHGVTRCPVAFAAPVAGVLSSAQEAERIASLPVENQLTRAQVLDPFSRLWDRSQRRQGSSPPAIPPFENCGLVPMWLGAKRALGDRTMTEASRRATKSRTS